MELRLYAGSVSLKFMPIRVACVTGASRGIGRALSLGVGRGGLDVVGGLAEDENNEAVAAEIRAGNANALVVHLDVTSLDSIKQAFDQVRKELGRIDVLVNNAGITRDGLALRMKPDDWNLVLQINLTGAFHCIQQVLQGMMRDRWGRIINIASVVGKMGNAGQANYVSSKAGIIGLTKAIAQEMGSRGITVNAVAPGFIETDMTRNLSQELKDKMLANIPLRRIGQPEDVAAAVKFLASDDASYITGCVIDVNRGIYM